MFLFIAYKPDSADYCRGCLMASYRGDLEIRNWLSKEELIKAWTPYLVKNKKLGCNETGYSFYIFKEGIKVFNENTSYWDGGERYGYNTDEYYEHYNELVEQENVDLIEIEEIYKTVQHDANNILYGEKMKAAAQAAAENAAKAAQDKELRRKQYETLQKEFGNE